MNALKRAAEILREDAENIREGHTLGGDWQSEDKAKADHDEMVAVAEQLDALQGSAAVPEGWRTAKNGGHWPHIGGKYLIKLNGVLQHEIYEFDQADDGCGGGEYFWDRDDLDEAAPFDPENDSWLPIDQAGVTTSAVSEADFVTHLGIMCGWFENLAKIAGWTEENAGSAWAGYRSAKRAMLAAPHPDHSPDAGKVVPDLTETAIKSSPAYRALYSEKQHLLSLLKERAADGGEVEPVGWIWETYGQRNFTAGTHHKNVLEADGLTLIPVYTHPAESREEIQAGALEAYADQLDAVFANAQKAGATDCPAWHAGQFAKDARKQAARLRSNGGEE